MFPFQIGMCSACINPIIYAYWNETFREEFISIGKTIKSIFFDIHYFINYIFCGIFKKQNITTDDHQNHNTEMLADSPQIKTRDLVTAHLSPAQQTTIKMCHLQSHLIPREAQIISYPK